MAAMTGAGVWASLHPGSLGALNGLPPGKVRPAERGLLVGRCPAGRIFLRARGWEGHNVSIRYRRQRPELLSGLGLDEVAVVIEEHVR